MPTDTETLVSFSAEIAATYVANNSVAVSDIGKVIESVFAALQQAEGPKADPVEEKPKGAVSMRASVKPHHIVSMIDGKPYKMLKRHLTLQGYTAKSYREAFGLPDNYPMVAPEYAATRRALALKIGLGRKPGTRTGKAKSKS